MKRFLLICAIFPLLLSAAFTGEWRATAQAVSAATHQPQKIAIYVNLTQTANGVTGTATATGGVLLPIQNVVVSGAQIAFSIAETAGTTSFALAQAASTGPGGPTLTGTVTIPGGQILPVTFAAVR
jgi:hypothetical protein